MSREEEVLEKLKEKFGEGILGVNIQRQRRIFVEIDRSLLREVLSYLRKELNFDHISTIMGYDYGYGIELIYHLTYEDSLELSVKLKISREKPEADSVSDIYPAAAIYEREVHDLLGVEFKGNPDLSPLILPDEWPAELRPLRKDEKLEDIKSAIEAEAERR